MGFSMLGRVYLAALSMRRGSAMPQLPPTSDIVDDVPGTPAGLSSYHEHRRAQALAQQQAVFGWQLSKDRCLFKLHLAMGWATFGLLPASALAAFAVPRAAPYVVTLTGLAAWNWRRTLRRDAGVVQPTTNDGP